MKTTRLAYSISEACGLLSVGRTTLYSAIKKGDLKTCKVGRRTLVTVESLQLWLESLPNSIGVPSQSGTTIKGGNHE
jgi:excisionase family DNA binding protein